MIEAAEVAAEWRRTRRDKGRKAAKSTTAVAMTAAATPALRRNAEAASVRNISAAEKPLASWRTAQPCLQRLPTHQLLEMTFLLPRLLGPRGGQEGTEELLSELGLHLPAEAGGQTGDDDLEEQADQRQTAGDHQEHRVPPWMAMGPKTEGWGSAAVDIVVAM